MGRLIDSDVITDFMLEHNTQDSLFASVEEIVSYQPTAYDVDAVINKLQSLNERLCFISGCKYKHCDTCVLGEFFERQMDIIERGGVK